MYCMLNYIFCITKKIMYSSVCNHFSKALLIFYNNMSILEKRQYCVLLCITRKEALSTDNIQHSPFITQLPENQQN